MSCGLFVGGDRAVLDALLTIPNDGRAIIRIPRAIANAIHVVPGRRLRTPPLERTRIIGERRRRSVLPA